MPYQLPEGTIELPDEWTDLTTHEFVDSEEDGFRLEIAHSANEDGATPEEVVQEAKDRLQGIPGDDLQVLSESGASISGLAARMLVMRDRSEDPNRMMQITVLQLPSGRLLTFSASAPADVWDKYKPEVDKVIGSIRPTK